MACNTLLNQEGHYAIFHLMITRQFCLLNKLFYILGKYIQLCSVRVTILKGEREDLSTFCQLCVFATTDSQGESKEEVHFPRYLNKLVHVI